MKGFALFSFSILCLVLAVTVGGHLGSQDARAQAPGLVIGFTANASGIGGDHYVMLDNGDVYYRRVKYGADGALHYDDNAELECHLNYVGNFWSGGPVSTSPESWGAIKDRYKK